MVEQIDIAGCARDDRTVADVSVVMATYNGARFIEHQIRSIGAQTVLPSQIVVSDDGSTDDTIAKIIPILESLPIRSVIVKNDSGKGYSNNFFTGCSKADARYIAFCDQDDIWEREKLETCLDSLVSSNALLCAHAATLIDGAGTKIGNFWQGPKRSKTLHRLGIRPWFTFAGFTMIFEASLLETIGTDRRGHDFYRYGENLSHDSWITFLASCFGEIVYIRDRLVRYRQHDLNVIGAKQDSVARRLLLSLGPAADPALNRSAVARRWAAELRRVAARQSDDDTRTKSLQAARFWTRISAIELTRIRMYRNATIASRASTMLSGMAKGFYSKSRGGLGYHYIVKDVLVGILGLSRN